LITSDTPDDVPAWVDLVLGLSQEKAFFSLRRTYEGMMRKNEETSKKVLDFFFRESGKTANPQEYGIIKSLVRARIPVTLIAEIDLTIRRW
jgi:hypothetical protein